MITAILLFKEYKSKHNEVLRIAAQVTTILACAKSYCVGILMAENKPNLFNYIWNYIEILLVVKTRL